MQYFVDFRSNGLYVVYFYADYSKPYQHTKNLLADLFLEDKFQVTFIIITVCTKKTIKIFFDYYRTFKSHYVFS